MDEAWAGVPDLLSRLEDRELPLLSWGIVDGFLSADEVAEAIEAQLDVDAADPNAELHSADAYLQHLLDAGLLHRVPATTPRYRTRLGETLRLLRTLRQLWPPSDTSTPTWWRNSSTLVADYRLRVAPRRYPRRTIAVEDASASLSRIPGWSPGHAQVLERIAGDNKLARFQVDAAAAVLQGLSVGHLTARIVTAGTGSGKTLAFYLPALLDIAATSHTPRVGPHTLALYPRNELLRDQAREALLMARKIGGLNGAGSRPARVGLLYGSTPSVRDFQSNRPRPGWKRVGHGWAAPYFPCLTDGCLGHLIWLDSDRDADRERLECDTCGTATAPDTLAITRESIRRDPPDILFSSTEMLSKHSTSDLARVLGWKGPNGIRMVLLDEAHTYSGVHGAQVALMLRRWRYANRQWGRDSPVIVGLSATLRDAGDFFANLTGADRRNVEVIAPSADDLEATSREYGIVLRGDPISGTALLSTTIQTAMLVERMMDVTPGTFGSVTFAFTDDLDSINRLYDNLRDAEGHSPRGRAGGAVLADLRSPAAPQAGARYEDGQSWDLPAYLQRMGRGLRIARTSSQDTGVDSAAEVVVATSSLEVGFNDPRVGAVIQHKSPRDLASFLQRRGRAGRRLGMRPMTVVVLSDYGRDRVAYQTYERLLDPEIDVRTLPVSNRFVVKIQATHALIDWLGRKTNSNARAVLAPPNGAPQPKSTQVRETLALLLEDRGLQEELAEHLRRALGLPEEEMSAALWEEPRSLMLSVVPTALRRLESGWTPLAGGTDPGAIAWTPLPEFMTSSLFGALNTPDVEFELPANFREQPEPMPLARALREAVPGRVSRRYGHAHASLSTWLPIPLTGSDLPLTDVVARGHGLGQWTTPDGENYIVVRPLALRLVQPPRTISDTSSAQPMWRSAFEVDNDALQRADLPTPSVWSDYVTDCAFALHVGGGPLRVRRMVVGSDGELTLRDGSTQPLHVRYQHEGVPAALGYELDVDAMLIEGCLPLERRTYLGDYPESPAGRTLVFRRLVLEDQRLNDVANTFQRQWLTEAYLHSFVQVGLAVEDVNEVPARLAHGHWSDDLAQFLAVAYRADDAAQLSQSRTLASLTTLAANPIVRSVIEEHAHVLVTANAMAVAPELLDRIFRDTLASAVLTAVQEGLPDAQDEDLVVDVELGHIDRAFRILVSETSIGGLGLVEKLHRDYVQDPRRFWDAVGRAIEATDAEEVDDAMHSLVADLARPDSELAQAAHAFRSANGVATMDQALGGLLETWEEIEGPPTHLLVSTLAARLLRPGSTQTIDRILAELADAWRRAEVRLGIEIDARTLAYHAAQGHLGIDTSPLNVDGVFSLLWLRGPQARGQRLEHWHPYRADMVSDRQILERVVGHAATVVDVTQSGWIEDYSNAIRQDGVAVLSAPYSARRHLADAIRLVIVTPIERDGLRSYGRVVRIRQRHGQISAQVALAEELQ